MNGLDNSLPELAKILEQRIAVVGSLAESLETGRLALGSNDASAIARGAAHQAELCRQWARLEEQLRAEAARRRLRTVAVPLQEFPDGERSAQLESEWEALSTRIRYLGRVHWSLLRHMQRSLAIWSRVIDTCAPTYTPTSGVVVPPSRPHAGE
jgi:hypothetical protein